MLEDEAQTDPNCTHVTFNNSVIWGTTFWPSGQKDVKSVFIFSRWLVEAETKFKSDEFAVFFYTFNFIRGLFSNVNILLTSLATWSKSCLSDFLLIVQQQNYLGKRARGRGMFLLQLSAYLWGNLNFIDYFNYFILLCQFHFIFNNSTREKSM